MQRKALLFYYANWLGALRGNENEMDWNCNGVKCIERLLLFLWKKYNASELSMGHL